MIKSISLVLLSKLQASSRAQAMSCTITSPAAPLFDEVKRLQKVPSRRRRG